MDLRKITDDFSVSPQIDAEHMPEIAGAGFRSVICNRPDGEEPGQPLCDMIAEAARAEGLEFRMIPISSGMISASALEEFRTALKDLPKPVLSYCRSGTRCTILWSIAQYGKLDDEEILSRTATAGYDMTGLLAQLRGQ